MRTRVNEQSRILKKVVKRYKINLIDKDIEDTEQQQQQIKQKRKIQIENVYTSGEEEEDEGVDEVAEGIACGGGDSGEMKM